MSTMHDEAKTIICKNCGYENNKQSKFCPNCGEKVVEEDICANCGGKVVRDDICANCGAKIDPSLKFCHECGSKTPKFIALEKAEVERIAREVLEEWNMVRIPDNTTHKGLYFGKYQVTQAQWKAIMGNNPSIFKGKLSRPVENVSWYECQEFIKKLNARAEVKLAGIIFRLPTEEEWEYACRAGSTGKYGLLADGREGSLDEMGWYKDNSRCETHPVGKKKPNAWGLYDMHGNVWEWTDSGNDDYRVCRGGSLCDRAEDCETGYRDGYRPDGRILDLGFRLAASRTGK